MWTEIERNTIAKDRFKETARKLRENSVAGVSMSKVFAK
jgi:hypothetical protein